MRKNKLFIAGLVTVFVALVSLTLVSSTWAKYTSTQSGHDSARVAYWGINEVADYEFDLFAETYAKADGNVKGDDSVSADEKVIAPGTEGTLTINLEYNDPARQPEVAYSVKYDFSQSEVAEELASHPNIKWTITIGTTVFEGTWKELMDANKLVHTEYYDADEEAKDVTIAWEWAFEGNDKDSSDTDLGNDASAVALIKLTLTATQLD